MYGMMRDLPEHRPALTSCGSSHPPDWQVAMSPTRKAEPPRRVTNVGRTVVEPTNVMATTKPAFSRVSIAALRRKCRFA